MCTLFSYTIDWILGQALQDYPGVQVGASVQADVQGLLEAVNCHTILLDGELLVDDEKF